ncbi:uncharacterized protein LOC136093129 [Hydra vulgaris]|uniref:uncharacterized protein LOC136093129 n=1 Tax=Hydra vulgaris TaxID=6087 RepID=UPI0032E9C3F7
MKEITGKQKSCLGFLPQMIKVDNISLYDPRAISHEFNKFFIGIGPSLSNRISNTTASFNDFLVPMDNCICSDELSSELSFKEFEVALNSVKRNKATGADKINGNVIIDCFDILKHILFKVFRASINQGIFPEQLKVAKVTPIFKEGGRSNISNFRPISVLSISQNATNRK